MSISGWTSNVLVSGWLPTKREAAVLAEMREFTFVHQALGRQSAEDFYLY